MKCIYCDKDEGYLFRGNSYCKDCLIKFHGDYYPWAVSGFSTENSVNWYRNKVNSSKDVKQQVKEK